MKKVKAGKAGLDPVTQRLVMSVLTDKTLLKTFAWVDELNHELEMLPSRDPVRVHVTDYTQLAETG